MIGDYAVHDVCTNLYDDMEPPDNWKENLIKLNKQEAIEKLAEHTDSLVPNEKSVGWKFDAHKNLPGWVLLYEKYPEAEWYVMIDDDTYLFPRYAFACVNGLYQPLIQEFGAVS